MPRHRHPIKTSCLTHSPDSDSLELISDTNDQCLALAAAFCLSVPGCGGGGTEEKSFAQVRDCMTKNPPSGYEVSTKKDDLDLISQAAGQGGLAFTSDKQEVQISVERSASDADNTAKQYEAFGEAFGGGHVDKYGNVVAAYTKTPTDAEKSYIEGCVK
jgi:hypothetical protein